MKKLFILIIITGLFYSCNDKIEIPPPKETTYAQQVVLKNETSNSLEVRVYPTGKYRYGTMYRFADQGSGYRDMVFQIAPGAYQDLFTTSDTAVKPNAVLQEVFDSIVITAGSHVIRFSVDNATGYQTNPYSSGDLWNYATYPMYFMGPVEMHQSVFVLSPDTY